MFPHLRQEYIRLLLRIHKTFPYHTKSLSIKKGMEEEILEQSDLYEHHRIIADKGQSLLRVDKFLFNRLEKVYRNKIQMAIKAGNVLVNGISVKPNYRIKPLDLITVVLPYPHIEYEVEPENITL